MWVVYEHVQGKMSGCKLILFLAVCVAFRGVAGKPPKLGHFKVDKDQCSVSGLSGGGFFAVQFHIAFSETIVGAGIIAGGPYWCAQYNYMIAEGPCMKDPDLISVETLVGITYSIALSGTIDQLSHLANDRVYLFSGSLDTEVVPGVMEKLVKYYSNFVKPNQTQSMFSIPAEHAMVTDNFGNKCDVFSSPYINNCNFSTAYHLLKHIYPNVNATGDDSMKPSNLFEFDQSEFFANLPELIDMDTVGYVYVPSNCQNGSTVCRLHIAFHGCRQGRKYISTDFALHAGYNSVAEANNIIILYPQAQNSTTINPKGCFDWWGYTSPAYGTKLGPQMAGVKLMLDRIVY